ncbi:MULTISPECIES: hypothetical protein [Parachlamydia]|uniref:hypothetical protein n=1 Tax=Parachlamydia TaxID=83551 RepID=UPI0001C1751D|nr:hypothetical protein [Parachlamydia acanthamoebae]EFB40982.1 hypothetical protein pah_c173o034 [Parachlamydia acanthamoebae str. Hall's coccus]
MQVLYSLRNQLKTLILPLQQLRPTQQALAQQIQTQQEEAFRQQAAQGVVDEATGKAGRRNLSNLGTKI